MRKRKKPYYERFLYNAVLVCVGYIVLKIALFISTPIVDAVGPPIDENLIFKDEVFDNGHVISGGRESVLDFIAKITFKSKGIKILIVTVHKLPGNHYPDKIPNYILEEWLYKNNIMKAIVIFLSKKENFIKIGVSDSLKDKLSEEKCEKLLKENFYPYIKRKFYHRMYFDYIFPIIFGFEHVGNKGYDEAFNKLFNAIDDEL